MFGKEVCDPQAVATCEMAKSGPLSMATILYAVIHLGQVT